MVSTLNAIYCPNCETSNSSNAERCWQCKWQLAEPSGWNHPRSTLHFVVGSATIVTVFWIIYAIASASKLPGIAATSLPGVTRNQPEPPWKEYDRQILNVAIGMAVQKYSFESAGSRSPISYADIGRATTGLMHLSPPFTEEFKIEWRLSRSVGSVNPPLSFLKFQSDSLTDPHFFLKADIEWIRRTAGRLNRDIVHHGTQMAAEIERIGLADKRAKTRGSSGLAVLKEPTIYEIADRAWTGIGTPYQYHLVLKHRTDSFHMEASIRDTDDTDFDGSRWARLLIEFAPVFETTETNESDSILRRRNNAQANP